MKRTQRLQIANETLAILNAGVYISPTNRAVTIRADLAASVSKTRVVRPEEWPEIITLARAKTPLKRAPTVEVTGETTLAAARRMHAMDSHQNILALNFASAKNPGGGFLSGAQAQEESLARGSGLYSTLLAQPLYYDANRAEPSKLYTDHAIVSPSVPVFRSDDGALLETPYPITFLTMPAPNRGAIEPASAEARAIPEILRRRMEYLFAVAAKTSHDSLILGAWGCGVFRNDPVQVAALFVETLFGIDGWAKHFHHLCFAVFDSTPECAIYHAFEQVLLPHLLVNQGQKS